MNDIQIITDLATIKADQRHMKESLEKIEATLDAMAGVQQSVSTYKKLTWLNLGGMLSAAGAVLWPK